MNTIKLNNPLINDIPVDITYVDSNEDSKIECRNHMIMFNIGSNIFQYLNADIEKAMSEFSANLKMRINHGGMMPPEIVFCSVVRFKTTYEIDWSAIQRHYYSRKSMRKSINKKH